ncbi:MAG: YggS family pyridoxal phosphate-dependent enzyme [Burkholderiales bacterium]|nr:YggS family pyridoxal phosphate-dependent enzyme [Burkholderiales bacterium]MDP2399792.1 YggS family pyridoxal phosphate-dependent enzyme [Burkholderiales bacterium]
MATITDNLQAVHRRIALAAAAANRATDSIKLLAVSKTFSAAAVLAAWQSGQRAFGENFVQEGIAKITELSDLGVEWHFIGPVQSNKTRLIAEHFAWVHSIEREKIAQRLNDARPPQLPPLNVLIQVNVSGEASKSGVDPGTEGDLAAFIRRLPRLRLRGLMAIPEPTPDTALQRERFALLHRLLQPLRADDAGIDTLSMGMSDDLEAAIAEGSTLVRVGTAIFGKRQAVNGEL